MISNHKVQIKLYAIYLLLLVLFGLLSFNYALNFHFWLDDWMNLWFVLNGYVAGYKGQFDTHPGNYVLFIPQAYLFGMNPFYYNWFGLFFKILTSLAIGGLAWSITKNRKSFFVASLLYVSYFGGLESHVFTTARNNVLNLIVVSLTVFFYLTSKSRRDSKIFILALFFLTASFLSDPARVLILPLMFIAYEIILWLGGREKLDRKKIVTVLLILGISLITFFSTPLGRSPANQVSSGHFRETFLSSEYYQVFLSGLGDLIGGYIHLFTPSVLSFSWIIGIISLFSIIFWSVWQIVKGRNLEMAVFIHSMWGFLFLNWIAFPYLFATSQHRYQTISSAFFVVLLTFVIIKAKRVGLIILSVLLLLNLTHSFVINKRWDDVRDYYKIQGLIDSELSLIPTDVKPQLLVVEGNSAIVSEGIGWTFGGIVPYSFAKGITKMEDLPSSAPTFEQDVDIFCNKTGKRPVVGDMVVQTEKMSINKVFGFKVNDFEKLDNNTDQVRMRILGQADCIKKNPGFEISPQLKLVDYIASSDMYNPLTTGVFLNWHIDKTELSSLSIDYLSDRQTVSLKETHFPVNLNDVEENFNQIVFLNGQTTHSQLIIRVDLCGKDTCTKKTFALNL